MGAAFESRAVTSSDSPGVAAVETAAATIPTVSDGRWRALGVKFVVVGGFLAGLHLSPKLWLAERSYPLSPVLGGWPNAAPPYDRIPFGALLVSLLAVALLPRPRWAIALAALLLAYLGLGDQSRWQPWAYQYLFLLLALATYPWGRARAGTPMPAADASLNACRLVIAATYFWSGLQKCNASFVGDVGPWLLEPVAGALSLSDGVIRAAAYAMPPAEILVGLGLLFRPTRVVAAMVAVLMHGVILWSIGPWGHGWNSVVWPWNVAMAMCVLLLFVRTPRVSARATVVPAGPTAARVVHGAVLVLFGVMPLLSFFGRWDAYLSACLYSGNTPRGDLRLNGRAYDALPPHVRALCQPLGEGRYELSLFDWSIAELNVPPYPARRVFRRIGARVSEAAGDEAGVTLVVHERPRISDASRQTTECVFGAD